MSERNERHDPTILDRATQAMRAVPTPAGPPADVVARALEALNAASISPDIVRLRERRKLMFRILRYSTGAVAGLLAIVAGTIWLMDRNASVSFAQVVDNVQKAKSVSFVLKQKLGGQPELESRMFIQGDFFRYELDGPPPMGTMLIMIVNGNERKGLQLDVARKIATKIDLEGRVPAEELREPIERLRNLKANANDNVTALGDEELNGRKCQVYQVKGRIKEASRFVPDEFKLWVDAKSGWPVRIQAADAQTSLTFELFKWDEPLRDELFSLKVPRGYLLEQLTPAVVRPGRIYYHQGHVDLRSIQPDGKNPEVEFVPHFADSPRVYSSDRTEMSPDARYLAIAYTNANQKGSFPPDRVLLFDRTRSKEPAAEVYVRPEGEMQFWQFSADGRRLFVTWWEGLPGKQGEGHYGTDVADIKAGTKETLKLPAYTDADGKKASMRFAVPAPDGQTYLVVGDGLHVATAAGKLVRRLSPAHKNIIVASVRVSPDGKQAVYATYHEDRSQQLFVVPLAGGNPKELVPPQRFTDLRARWSPDGKRVAYTSRLLDPSRPPRNHGTETYLKLVDPDGANPVTLLTQTLDPRATSLELIAWR
jgi:outer membrane lipoprotein-sorting protein